MNDIEEVAQRIERRADRCDATGDKAGAAMARHAAADARRCLSVRDAIKIEEALANGGTGGPELADRGGCLGFFKRGSTTSSLGGGGGYQSPPGIKLAGAAVAAGIAGGAAYSLLGGQMRSGGSPAWRNHNPGMLPYDAFAIEMGAIGMAEGIAVFPDAATGAAALQEHLRRQQQRSTETDSGSGSDWSTDETRFNRSAAYQSAGIPADKPIGSLSEAELARLSESIANQTTAKGAEYTPGSPDAPPWVNEVAASSANS